MDLITQMLMMAAGCGGTDPGGGTALVGFNTNTNLAAGNFVTITKPAGVQVGDLMLVLLNGNFTHGGAWINSSFTFGYAGSNSVPSVGVAYRVATQADVDNTLVYTFTTNTTSTSRNWRATMVVYRNVTWQKISSEQSIRAGDLITTGPSLVFYFAAWTNNATPTAPPVNMTLLFNVTATTGTSMAVFTETRAATAAAGANKEPTFDVTPNNGKSLLFALTTS